MKRVNKIAAIILGFTLMLSGFTQIASATDDTKEYIAVTDQVLRWRDSDRASSNGFISEGQKVQFVEEKGTDWFKVKAGEKEGYVRRGELTSVKNYNDTEEASIHETPMKTKEALDKLVLTIDVSLRTKDESIYRPITLLKRESEVTYEGTTQKDWFKVDYKGQKGYVYRGDVTSKKNWEDQDKTIHETAMADKEDFGKLEVLFDVNLRTKDENQYRPITLLSKGDVVHYQGTTKKGWFKVKNEAGDEGYVYRGNVTKYEDLELSKDTVLDKDEAFVNVTKDKAVIDLNGHKVETLTVIANDTIIKNGEVRNIIIGKDVENITLEDITDDGEGNHDFAGGGAESIVLKGDTNLRSNIQITSSRPIQIRSVDLKEGKGLQGKLTIDTGAAVTLVTSVEELEVKKPNKDIKIKAAVKKVTALADTKITLDKGIKIPKLKKDKGVKATVIDGTGKEEEFEESLEANLEALVAYNKVVDSIINNNNNGKYTSASWATFEQRKANLALDLTEANTKSELETATREINEAVAKLEVVELTVKSVNAITTATIKSNLERDSLETVDLLTSAVTLDKTKVIDWKELPSYEETPLDQAWSIDMNRNFTAKEIESVSILKDNRLIAANIDMKAENKKIIVMPAKLYEENAEYSLRMFLSNGNQYRMNFKTKKEIVNKLLLEEKIKDAKNYDEYNYNYHYTEESWKTFEKALKEAELVMADKSANQNEVDFALGNLKESIVNLERSSFDPTDKWELEERIEEVEQLNNRYTDETWEQLQESLKKAKAIIKDKKASQVDINLALKNLEDSINSLEFTMSDAVRKRINQIEDEWVKFKPSFKEVRYIEEPQSSPPYKLGKLSDETLNNALKATNFIRYIAYLPSDVVLDDEFNTQAQAASVVNAANGVLTHHPEKPVNMGDEFFQLGKLGASTGNIGRGYQSILDSILNGYMEDADERNIDRVGHRRWILSPKLKKVGFGFTADPNYTAMKVISDDMYLNKHQDYDYISWPAKVAMPIEHFNGRYNEFPWSVSLNAEKYNKNKLDGISVELTRLNDDKKWKFNQKLSNGYFNIDTDNFGHLPYTIIFRPEGTSYQAGDKYKVTISNITTIDDKVEEISFETTFFNLE